MHADESDIDDRYHTLVRDVYGDELREANSHYPSKLSARFDWEAINDYDETIATAFLENPKSARTRVDAAIRCWDAIDMPEAVVRVHNLPEEYHFRVGKQRTTHLGGLITVQGEVVEMEGVKPFAREAALECHRCGTLNHQPQSYGKMIYPHECMGCEKSGKPWRFRRDQSDLIDSRRVVLQRADTNLDDDPPMLVVYLTQDLVDRVGPGDFVSLAGYYDTAMIQKQSILETYLETWDIESHEEGVLTDRLSPEELASTIMDEVEALQDRDPSSFGANRDEVLERITDQGVRENEVESQLETLIDSNEVSEVGGDNLMIT